MTQGLVFSSPEGSWGDGCSSLGLHGHDSCQLTPSWDAKNQQYKVKRRIFIFQVPSGNFWQPLQHSGMVGMVADLSLAGGHDLGAEGAQASQGHPKEPCRNLRPCSEGCWRGGMEPPPHHYHLCVPSSSPAVGRAQRDSPKAQRLGKGHSHFLSFSPAVFSICLGFFFFFSSLEKTSF